MRKVIVSEEKWCNEHKRLERIDLYEAWFHQFGNDECEDHELCPIIGASFIGEAIQWRRVENGELICTEYQKHKPIANPSQGKLI